MNKKVAIIEPEEDQTYRIYPVYRRKCDNMGMQVLPYIKQFLELATEIGGFKTLKTDQQLGPMHIRALFQAIVDIKYDEVTSLYLHKIKLGDEGVRAICRYISMPKNKLQLLDVIQNQISALGCQFFGKCLYVPACNLKILKLDDNIFGTEGLKNLTYGLRTNQSLTKISMKYCGIDSKGAIYIQQILANIKTKIRSLKLQGNTFGNQGIYNILRAVQINQTLQKLNIADTGLNLLDFKAKVLKILEKIDQDDQIKSEQFQEKQQLQQNPQDDLQANKKQNKAQPSIQNVKQTIKIQNDKQYSTNKLGKIGMIAEKLQQKFPQKQEQYKIIRELQPDDTSIQAEIMRLLLGIMQKNNKIIKYDIRFNPICDDAAFMIFQTIQENIAIKDIQFNNNVDYQLRENLDTLMRMRTGRMPKGKRGKAKGKGKKKKGKK